MNKSHEKKIVLFTVYKIMQLFKLGLSVQSLLLTLLCILIYIAVHGILLSLILIKFTAIWVTEVHCMVANLCFIALLPKFNFSKRHML